MKLCKILIFSLLLLSIQNLFSQNQQEIEQAKQLFAEANNMAKTGNYKAAIAKMTRAAELFKKNGYEGNYLISSLSVANFSINANAPQNALTKLRQIRKDFFDYFKNDIKQQTEFYYLKAKAFSLSLQKDSSVKYFGKALALIDDNEQLLYKKALIISDLAKTYASFSNYDSALIEFSKAKKIFEKLNLQNSYDYWLNIAFLGNIYKNTGRLDSAVYYENLTIENASVFGQYNPALALAYSTLGQVYLEKNAFDKALANSQKALEINKILYSVNSLQVADQLINIANIYNATYDYNQALAYYRQALEIYKKLLDENDLRIADLQNNIAIAYINFGSFNNARRYLQNALKIRQNHGLYYSKQTGIILSNLGFVYYNQADYDNAIKFYNSAIDVFKKLYGQKSFYLIKPYLNLANIYSENKQFAAALTYFKRSIVSNLAQISDTNAIVKPVISGYADGIALIEAYNGIGRLFLLKSFSKDTATDVLKTALQWFYVADSVINLIRQDFTEEQDKIRVGEIARDLYQNAVLGAFLLYKNLKNPAFVRKAFFFVERSKAAALVNAVYDRQAKQIAGIPQNLIDKEKFIRKKLSYFKIKLKNATDDKAIAILSDSLIFYQNELRKLISTFERDYPGYYELKYRSPVVQLSDIQSVLKDDELFVDYMLTEENLFVIRISASSADIKRVRLKEGFRDGVAYLLSKCVNPGAKEEHFDFYANFLYKNLFPFEIEPNITHLIIIPDNYLNILPFEILTTQRTDTTFANLAYLIKKYSVSYNYSAYLYLELARTSAKYGKDFLAFAPVFQGVTARSFDGAQVEPLPGTAAEIDTIGLILRQNGYQTLEFQDTAALKTTFVAQVGKPYKIVHLATHGFINSQTPELSALLFAPYKGKTDDLFLPDIYSLNLDIDLLVLSACETGRGKLSKGEGVIGISRAFVFAGAKNMIISLWKVSDEGTKNLMINFYHHLANDKKRQDNYAEYLRKAKLDMLKSRFFMPFFWAPFILIGK